MSKELPHIFFSGVESQQAWDNAIDAGARHVLMSIHYLQTKTKSIEKRITKNPDVKILIDSGAYTFINNPKYKDQSVGFWESYVKDYVQWVREHRDVVFACVELDIDDLVGTDVVNQWRKKYWEPLEADGVQVCYVWHDVKGTKEWKKMCKKYKYVGFSFMSDEQSEVKARKMLRVAEMYKAKVHGFAMTSIDMLTRLPFYTVDSTTWLVGKQYGELNFFDGRKMKRLKKPEWKKQKIKLQKLGVDWDKLKAEDPREMDIANVKAFLSAENYVQKRMKNRMYWNSRKIDSEVSDESTEDVFEPRQQDPDDITYPDIETWDREENLIEYCLSMNINPKLGSNTILSNTVVDCTTFMNSKKYKERIETVYDDELLSEICTQYFQEAVSDRKKAIRRLREFFYDVVSGNREDFYSRSFDEDNSDGESEDAEFEVAPRPKEREEYLVDDEIEMPEVEEYDGELMIVGDNKPERTEDGKFVPGHNKVRKPKNLYSEKFPKMACDTCYAADRCPEFKPGMVCAFQKLFKKFDSRDAHDVIEQMISMTNMNAERIMAVAMFEKLDGGMPDANLTNLMNTQMQWLNNLMQLRKAAATPGESIHVNISGSGPGVLSKIFGAGQPEKATKEKPSEQVVDAEFEEL